MDKLIFVSLTKYLTHLLMFTGSFLVPFCMRNNSAYECAAAVHLDYLVSDAHERAATDIQLHKTLRGHARQKEKM